MRKAWELLRVFAPVIYGLAVIVRGNVTAEDVVMTCLMCYWAIQYDITDIQKKVG